MSNISCVGIKFDLIEAHDGFGKMVIRGLKLPKVGHYSALAEIWSSVKRRVYEKYDVMSAGVFQYDGELISCRFYLSVAECEDSATEKIGSFNDTFYFKVEKEKPDDPDIYDGQMKMFQDAITMWVNDEEWGYVPYVEYINSTDNPDIQVLKNMMDTFVARSGLETDADRKAKAKRKDKDKRKAK